MNMKDHILTALRELFNRWEELLASLNNEQINAPDLYSNWSIKDEIAHLWAWQQRSIARVEAALSDKEPVFPVWLTGVDPELEKNTDQINAWIYDTYREVPWSIIHMNWREGFLRFLELGGKIAENDMLNSGKYPWLDERPLAFIFLASYDHHQEHFESLIIRSGKSRNL